MTWARSRQLTLRAGWMAGAALALLCSTPALAQGQRDYDLPSGDAAQRVRALAAEAGVQVIAPNADLADVRTQPVRGRYSPAEALRQMLAGTGLEVAPG